MRSLVFSLAMALACAAVVFAADKPVDIKAPDGADLKGTYFSAGQPGPGVLLVHQCNMERHSWDGLANDLVDAGIHVLTFDLRGFESRSTVVPNTGCPCSTRTPSSSR